MIHRRSADIERKCRHGRIHQYAEVVPQVGARDAERVHGGQDEHIAGEEERDG